MVRGEQRNGGWSDIQPELLEEILHKLTLLDYLKCRRVCRSWRRIVNDAIATKGTCPPAPQFPFLMLLPCPPAPQLSQFPFMWIPWSFRFATLLDMTQEDTSYTMTPPQTWKSFYPAVSVFTVEGWTVFKKFYYHRNQKYELVRFSNPVSGEEFELPPLPPFSDEDFTVVSVKLVFSSAPISKDFLVVVCATIIFPNRPNNSRKQQLAFCKVTDKSWTLIPTDEYQPTFFDNFVILDWKLYAMQARVTNSLTVFNLRDSNIITSERLVMLNPNAIRILPSFDFKEGVRYYTKSEVRMTRDGDELLLVLHLTERALGKNTRKLTKGFRIFKLDICGPRWIEVDDLGDRVLLVDETQIQFISTKKIDLLGKLSGGNCVLFANKYALKHELGVFSLKDKSVKPLSLHPCFHPSLEGFAGRCLWFMPSLW